MSILNLPDKNIDHIARMSVNKPVIIEKMYKVFRFVSILSHALNNTAMKITADRPKR